MEDKQIKSVEKFDNIPWEVLFLLKNRKRKTSSEVFNSYKSEEGLILLVNHNSRFKVCMLFT